MLRSLIKASPLLFRPWFMLFRNSKTRTNLPDKKDYFYFGGFPRSGNSYFTNLIEELHPDIQFSHHLHTIAAMKMALNKKVPVIIIVRHPMESIASLLVMNQGDDQKRNRALMERYVKDYIDYHTFVLAHQQDLEVVLFEKVIKHPNDFLAVLYKVANPKIDPVKEGERSVEKLSEKTTIAERQQKMPEEHAVRYSSLPNKERTKLKEGIKEDLVQIEAYQKCVALYQSLKGSH
jgi:hypothetical protein